MCLLLSTPFILGLQPGDRISTLYQTIHNDWKTPWTDLPIHQMPRFRSPDSVIVRLTLPHPSAVDSKKIEAIRINPKEDVKFSLTFEESKLLLPMLILFDAKRRVSLKKLILTFYYDEYDLLRVSHEATYGPRIQQLDPSHPSLTGFELVTKWEGVQEENFARGIFVLFWSVLIIFIGLFVVVMRTFGNEEGYGAILSPKAGSKKKNRPPSSAQMQHSSSSIPSHGSASSLGGITTTPTKRR